MQSKKDPLHGTFDSNLYSQQIKSEFLNRGSEKDEDDWADDDDDKEVHPYAK